ncbi:helix-turn-helix domain-containing protein [Paenibacillus solisilvae]|uniref:Helix-turn-helix domain-containing protein n=1 Tax=Paenibacillus solisilvae TaxID=2486751 RepID=A0ABW0VVJ6_9BACL
MYLNKNRFGNYVKNRRSELGLSLSELALNSGLNSDYLGYLERGYGIGGVAVAPNLDDIHRISIGLGVGFHELIQYADLVKHSLDEEY